MMEKYMYVGRKDHPFISYREILKQHPTTWAIGPGYDKKIVKYLYVKDFFGYSFPVNLEDFIKITEENNSEN